MSMAILNLDTTAIKKSMFARDLSLNKTSKDKIFKVAVWSYYWCPPFFYALIYSPTSQGWMLWTGFLFLTELMVEHVSRRIQFGLIILVVGASFLVWVMVMLGIV